MIVLACSWGLTKSYFEKDIRPKWSRKVNYNGNIIFVKIVIITITTIIKNIIIIIITSNYWMSLKPEKKCGVTCAWFLFACLLSRGSGSFTQVEKWSPTELAQGLVSFLSPYYKPHFLFKIACFLATTLRK